MRNRVFMKIGILAFCVVALTGMFGCGPSEEEKANELYESGSYREALEAYEALENPSDEVAAKMDDCRLWLFVDYVRDEKEIRISGTKAPVSDTLINFTVTASESGEISVERFTQQASTIAVVETRYDISIPHQSNTATITGEYSEEGIGGHRDFVIGGTTFRMESSDFLQNAEGSIDLGQYEYGDKVEWDTDTNQYQEGDKAATTNLGRDELGNNADIVSDSIKALGEAMADSGTGCTLKTIGFDRL